MLPAALPVIMEFLIVGVAPLIRIPLVAELLPELSIVKPSSIALDVSLFSKETTASFVPVPVIVVLPEPFTDSTVMFLPIKSMFSPYVPSETST